MTQVLTYFVCFLAYWIIEALPASRIHRAMLNVTQPEESLLRMTETAARHGYSVTEHSVQTTDGYILGLFRVRKRGEVVRGAPVLLMGGLLQSGGSWLDAGPRAALGYQLAAAGRDLWLGNVRGSHHARRHAWLRPDTDAHYWRFSVHEIGSYDLPATIDYILAHTAAEKLNYIGYSQGGGTFFIMCSERPEYCDKVNVSITLAPATRLLRTKSKMFRALAGYFESHEDELNNHGVWEVFPTGGLVQSFSQIICAVSDRATAVCEAVRDAMDAPNPGSIAPSTFLTALASFPAGTSVHNLAKYGQSMKSKYFQKFDYGPEQNLVRYGSPTPPGYNLNAVTVPTVVLYGRNDGVVVVKDVKWLIQNLPNVIEAFQVQDPRWTHFDFALSQNVPKMIYPKIKEYLDKYS